MYSFDSHEGFTRSFKQLFGTTPSKVRRYLISYQVPELYVPSIGERNVQMEIVKNCLAGNMHQLIFEVLRMSFEEAGAGYCTEINIVLYVKRGYIPDGNGVWYQEKTLEQYAPCCNDDDLVLFMSKKL